MEMNWISVKKELPEDSLPVGNTRKQIRCLVTTCSDSGKKPIKHVAAATRLKSYYGDSWYWSKDVRNVTHWMLLPKPAEDDIPTSRY